MDMDEVDLSFPKTAAEAKERYVKARNRLMAHLEEKLSGSDHAPMSQPSENSKLVQFPMPETSGEAKALYADSRARLLARTEDPAYRNDTPTIATQVNSRQYDYIVLSMEETRASIAASVSEAKAIVRAELESAAKDRRAMLVMTVVIGVAALLQAAAAIYAAIKS